jgi:hypothetical protein
VLLKKFPHAVNIPQPPSMFTPFLVRAEINNLFSFQVMLLSLHVKSAVLLWFKFWRMTKSLSRVVKSSNSLVSCQKHLNTSVSLIN